MALLVPCAFAVLHCEKLLETPPLAPKNDCREHACETFVPPARCSPQAGYCTSSESLSYFLLVRVPSGAPTAADSTFMVTSDELRGASSAGCPVGELCLQVPKLGRALGTYEVTPAMANTVGRNLGNPAGTTTLPAHTVFYPLRPGVAPTPLREPRPPLAIDFGFPNLPQMGTRISPAPVSTGLGPFGTPSLAWSVTLPPGFYWRVVMPDPPFHDAFPPREDLVKVDANVDKFELFTLTALDDPDGRRFTIGSANGALDLKGFTAVLQNSITQRAISPVVTLGSGTNQVKLSTTGVETLQDKPVELVVAPPPGREGIPSLIGQGPPTPSLTQTYPRFKLPVDAAGIVRGLGQPVQATVVIRSAFIDTDPPNVVLRYATTVRTDANGMFRTKLPPGRYDVAIFPENDSTFALWATSSASMAGVDAGTGVGSDGTPEGAWIVRDTPQAPKTFALAPKATLSGQAVLGDGTPLAEADVEAHAAAEPSSAPPGVPPPYSLPPFVRSMRTVQTRTDTEGGFALALDPGEYDIVVRPKDGTRFPWIVSTSRKMGNKDVTLQPLIVHAPIGLSRMLLADTSSGAVPVPEAWVRAFAVPPGKRIAVEIGRTFTGTDGKLELFLAVPRN
ncbi:hypothetical protein [Pendulispora albinea]|uniref:Carboxypeptidase regulatory-like domain-containing protein n=1 Tax=Pendulispora albinea TaxID=2741071 RepID=A0ABZ2M9E3_9BACT